MAGIGPKSHQSQFGKNLNYSSFHVCDLFVYIIDQFKVLKMTALVEDAMLMVAQTNHL